MLPCSHSHCHQHWTCDCSHICFVDFVRCLHNGCLYKAHQITNERSEVKATNRLDTDVPCELVGAIFQLPYASLSQSCSTFSVKKLVQMDVALHNPTHSITHTIGQNVNIKENSCTSDDKPSPPTHYHPIIGYHFKSCYQV